MLFSCSSVRLLRSTSSPVVPVGHLMVRFWGVLFRLIQQLLNPAVVVRPLTGPFSHPLVFSTTVMLYLSCKACVIIVFFSLSAAIAP